MSKHDHDEKHRCECEHARVKFCKKCQVVHCLDCNQEWGRQYNTWYYNSYPSTWTLPQYTLTSGTTTIRGTSALTSNTVQATGSIQTVSKLCDHGEQ